MSITLSTAAMQLYQAFFDQNSSVVLVVNPLNGKIEDASMSACRFYGYSKAQLLKMSVLDINTLSKEQITAEMKLAEEQKRNLFYFKHRLASGEIRNVEVTVFPLVVDNTRKLCSIVRDITLTINNPNYSQAEKTRLEAAVADKTYLLSQELRFKEALFDSIPGMLYVYDDQSKLIIWNGKHEEITGYTSDELAQMTIDKWFQKDDFLRVNQAISQIFEKGYGQIEANLIRKDKTMIHMLFNGVPLEMNGKKYFTGVGIDITERIESQKKLNHSIELMKYIIEHNNGGIAVHDLNMNYIYVSQHYLDEYGISKAEVIGRNHYEIFPDLPDKWKKVHQLAMQGIVSSAKDDPYVHDSGRVDWTSWECRPFYLDDGSIGGIIVYTEVTTARKLLEISLKKQKDLLETTLQSVGDAVISCNNIGRIVLMNKAAENMLNVSIETAYNKPIEDFMIITENCDLTNKEHVVNRVINKQITEELNDCAMLKLSSQIEIPIAGSVSPIFDKDHQLDGVVLIFRDISYLKKKQEEILYTSLHDSLTGLFNYRAFKIEVQKLLKEENLPITLMMGDVNGLKLINDSFGHSFGDQLLVSIARQLELLCPKDTLIFRYGGDEFVMAFPKMASDGGLRMIKHLKDHLSFSQFDPITVSVAVGFETINSVKANIQEILTEAENYMYRHKITENTSQKSKTIDVVMNALYAKNIRELYHSKRVGIICGEFANVLKWEQSDIKEMEVAGMLHDIGKIGISETILNKEGKLDDSEWKEILKHPEVGFRILSSVNEFSKMSLYVLEHQEKWNGTGYPRKLSGNDISIQARIIALADAYDAMTSKRTYRETLSVEQAVEEIRKYSGTQFDPSLTEPFIDMILNKGL